QERVLSGKIQDHGNVFMRIEELKDGDCLFLGHRPETCRFNVVFKVMGEISVDFDSSRLARPEPRLIK
ncbi:MAG: hypothetical protein JSV46_05215, partial [Candidatus Aminicenantes bacterium]